MLSHARPDVSNAVEFVTVPEVAHRLRMTERYVRGLIASGELPAVRVGTRAIRIRSTDVDALLEPYAGVVA